MVRKDHILKVRETFDNFSPDPDALDIPCLGFMEGGYSMFSLVR